MCLGKVVVHQPVSAPREVSDVVDVTFDAAQARVRTLFGEEHSFPGVSIRRIDMERGVVITLDQETVP